MSQFNTSEANKASAMNAQNSMAAQQFNEQLITQVRQFDSDLDYKTGLWNAQNAQAVEQSNIAWRRASNTAGTAAQNASNQQAAQFAFGMSQAEQNYMWQELRDIAARNAAEDQSTKERAMSILSAIYSNPDLMTGKGEKYARDELAIDLENVIGI